MSIADHVAIFLMGALDQPKAGKAKPNNPTYWGQFAFPPAAEADLLAACTAVAPNGSLAGLQLAVKKHANLGADKKFPGIADDWYIVRIGTGPDYPPDLFLTDGSKVAALPINGQQIRSEFFSGQRVRVNTYGFFYPPKNGGSAGISFNLSGLMAVGGGERRSNGEGGEPSESAFAKYRTDAPVQQSAPQEQTAQQPAQASGSNPFQQDTASTANPFG